MIEKQILLSLFVQFVGLFLIKPKLKAMKNRRVILFSFCLVWLSGVATFLAVHSPFYSEIASFTLFQCLYMAAVVDCYYEVVPNVLLLFMCILRLGFGMMQLLSSSNPATDVRLFLVNLTISFTALFLGYLVFRHSIGMGDLMLLLLVSMYLNFAAMVQILVFGAFAGAMYGLFLLLGGKLKERKEFPFVPFIFLGYIIFLIIYIFY